MTALRATQHQQRAEAYAATLKAGVHEPWLIYEWCKAKHHSGWHYLGTDTFLDQALREFRGSVPVEIIHEGYREFVDWRERKQREAE